MKSIVKTFLINYPQTDAGTVAFQFTTDCALGHFTFVFKWMNGVWNGWATLPSGEVRGFGCVPDVVDWTDFNDYGVMIDSPLPALGLGDLVANSTFYLIQWYVD